MTLTMAFAIVGILDLAWRIITALGRAGDAIDRAPWPAPRQTPEPARLRIVRHPYDWQRDGAA